MKTWLHTGAVLVTSLVLSGAAVAESASFFQWFGKQPAEQPAPVSVGKYSGFFKDYSGLREVTFKDGRKTERWISSGLASGHYSKLYIEPTVYYPAARPAKQVDKRLVEEVARYYGLKVAHQLRGGKLKVVDKPEPGALRLRSAITRLEKKRSPKAKDIQQEPPIAVVAGGVTGPAGQDRDITVYLESELSDAHTGEVLARSVKPDVSVTALAAADKIGFEHVRPVLDLWAADAQRFAEKCLPSP